MDYQRPNHVETPEEQARVQHSEWQALKIFVVIVTAIVLVAAIRFGMEVSHSMRELTNPRPASAAPARPPGQLRQAPALRQQRLQLRHRMPRKRLPQLPLPAQPKRLLLPALPPLPHPLPMRFPTARWAM